MLCLATALTAQAGDGLAGDQFCRDGHGPWQAASQAVWTVHSLRSQIRVGFTPLCSALVRSATDTSNFGSPSMGGTLTSRNEFRRDRGNSRAGAHALWGKAVGLGLVQLGGGTASGVPNSSPATEGRGMKKTQPGSSRQSVAKKLRLVVKRKVLSMRTAH